MVKCTYCGHEEVPIRGVHLITNEGVVQFLCSSKCRKNMLKLKRDRRKLKWTEAYRVALQKIRVAEAREKKNAESPTPISKVNAKNK